MLHFILNVLFFLLYSTTELIQLHNYERRNSACKFMMPVTLSHSDQQTSQPHQLSHLTQTCSMPSVHSGVENRQHWQHGPFLVLRCFLFYSTMKTDLNMQQTGGEWAGWVLSEMLKLHFRQNWIFWLFLPVQRFWRSTRWSLLIWTYTYYNEPKCIGVLYFL